jgi:2-oxoglutarate dehydrogenase complex dehydrogenase (E1) component-like enzyme
MSSPNRDFCALYYEKPYRKYLDDPNSVDEAWRRYFEQKESGVASNAHSNGLNINFDD